MTDETLDSGEQSSGENGESGSGTEQLPSEEEFRDLVADWRLGEAQTHGARGYHRTAKAYEKCADQLERLIEEKQRGDDGGE